MARREAGDLAAQLRALLAQVEAGRGLPAELQQRIAEAVETPWQARIRRGTERGLSPSQAAGKPLPGEAPASAISGRELHGAAERAARERAEREAAAAAAARPPAPPVPPAPPPVPAPPAPPPLPWRGPTPGGTRDFQTTDPALVLQALREALERGQEVLIGVRSDEIEHGPYVGRQQPRPDWAFTGRVRPDRLLFPIELVAGDVEDGLRQYLETYIGSSVGDVLEYQVKMFGDR